MRHSLIARTASEAKQDEAIYTYNSDDKLLTTTDANSNTITYAYDNMGRMTKVTDSQGNVTAYSYDSAGNLVSITDAEGHSTSNAYDALGRVTKITDPLGFTTQYSYDASGSLIKKIDANNQTTEYEYDSLSRLTKIFYGGKISPVKTIIFSYNKSGNMLTWDDTSTSLSASGVYTYDSLNRINSVTTTYPFGVETISYDYDKVGNRTRVIAPTGVIASPLGEAIYTYDALNRLISVDHGPLIVDYSYDNMSRLIKKTLPNGVYTDYTYDNLSRLTSLVNKKSIGEVISSFAYTHDKVGNRLTMDEARGASAIARTNYVYDNIYRLTNAAHPTASPESYTYDKVGNRKTSRDYPTWNYDANNRLTSYNGTTFNYDNNGNTISQTKSGQTTNYAYDYENRLSRIIAGSDGDSGVIASQPQAGEAIYTYDPFGRRLSKTIDGVIKYYLYDNEDIVAEYDNSGNLIASYVHGQGIDEPIKGLSPQGTVPEWYYTFDGLGSVSELTDATQNIVETYKYDSFGNLSIYDSSYVLRASSIVGNSYTYTGREFDSETGLYFYRARYYDASAGRFITADPIGFKGGMNFYTYAKGNPIHYIDPFGEQQLMDPYDVPNLDLGHSLWNEMMRNIPCVDCSPEAFNCFKKVITVNCIKCISCLRKMCRPPVWATCFSCLSSDCVNCFKSIVEGIVCIKQNCRTGHLDPCNKGCVYDE